MNQIQKNQLIIATKRCICNTFDISDWDELSRLTVGGNIINEHARLLKSLRFNDDDYGGAVFDVIKELFSLDAQNIKIVTEYINLEEWLKQNDSKLHIKIFGSTNIFLQLTNEKAVKNSFDLEQSIRRITVSMDSNPELAVGATKEMIESVLKCILEAHQEAIGKDELPQLLKRTQKILKLDPSDTDSNKDGADIIKRTLSNLGQIVTGISELRNIYGTGHGRAKRSGITSRHAKLVVGAGATLATFLMETFEHHQKNKS